MAKRRELFESYNSCAKWTISRKFLSSRDKETCRLILLVEFFFFLVCNSSNTLSLSFYKPLKPHHLSKPKKRVVWFLQILCSIKEDFLLIDIKQKNLYEIYLSRCYIVLVCNLSNTLLYWLASHTLTNCWLYQSLILLLQYNVVSRINCKLVGKTSREA